MKERIELLVRALESGEFTQTRRNLRSKDGTKHCCLGVACEIYRRETGLGTWELEDFLPTGPERKGVLPMDVQDWFGFDSDNPDILMGDDKVAAAQANDEGTSFAEIAKGFRATYLKDSECPTI